MPTGVYERTPEMRARASAARMGRKFSLAHCRAISKAAKKSRAHRRFQKGNIPGNKGRKGSVKNISGLWIHPTLHRAYVRLVTGWHYRYRIVWVQYNGPIPKGAIIHHINGDPLDDRIENLEVMTRKEHVRCHLSKHH